ncbi:hypothetical protein T492DRAFT_116194 [Pavlovales sp. CCMP2436]|nr:hypothetical protein T492DRAFT_116194 [Pavlovales sp. CCMP2436]
MRAREGAALHVVLQNETRGRWTCKSRDRERGDAREGTRVHARTRTNHVASARSQRGTGRRCGVHGGCGRRCGDRGRRCGRSGGRGWGKIRTRSMARQSSESRWRQSVLATVLARKVCSSASTIVPSCTDRIESTRNSSWAAILESISKAAAIIPSRSSNGASFRSFSASTTHMSMLAESSRGASGVSWTMRSHAATRRATRITPSKIESYGMSRSTSTMPALLASGHIARSICATSSERGADGSGLPPRIASTLIAASSPAKFAVWLCHSGGAIPVEQAAVMFAHAACSPAFSSPAS